MALSKKLIPKLGLYLNKLFKSQYSKIAMPKISANYNFQKKCLKLIFMQEYVISGLIKLFRNESNAIPAFRKEFSKFWSKCPDSDAENHLKNGWYPAIFSSILIVSSSILEWHQLRVCYLTWSTHHALQVTVNVKIKTFTTKFYTFWPIAVSI